MAFLGTGHTLDFVAIFGSEEFGTKRFVIFWMLLEGGFTVTLWTGSELLGKNEIMDRTLKTESEAVPRKVKSLFWPFSTKNR